MLKRIISWSVENRVLVRQGGRLQALGVGAIQGGGVGRVGCALGRLARRESAAVSDEPVAMLRATSTDSQSGSPRAMARDVGDDFFESEQVQAAAE